MSDVYRGVTVITVSDGSIVLFWKDLWYDHTIAETQPTAFSFAKDEDISMQTLLSANTIGDVFHLPFSIQAREEVRSLQLLMVDVDPGSASHDEWRCVWGGRGFASSKFNEYCFRDMQVDDAFSWIWRSKCTNKWKVFVWLLLVDRLNTRNMLRRRHYVLVDKKYSCLLCPSPPE